MKAPGVISLIAAAITIIAGPPLEASEAPVKVYILAGQSNMVGIGQVSGGSKRWGDEFIDPVLSVYEGAYNPAKNYDEQTPTQTVKLESFGGVSPQKYPGGGAQIVRGQLQVKETGIYEFFPGLGESRNAIMHVDGQEVWNQQPGELASQKSIKLDADKKIPFKVTYLTDKADGLGWIGRVDIPGTLKTLVHVEGKFPYLLDDQKRFAPRDDVWYKGVVTATANQWLNVGCGANESSIGPELGFGHMIGDFHDEPVLLIKCPQGGRDLGYQFLPPGSPRYTDGANTFAGYGDSPRSWTTGTTPTPDATYAGEQWDLSFTDEADWAPAGASKPAITNVTDILDNFATEYPAWAAQGFEIAGFVWWQGYNDMQGSGVPVVFLE